MAMIEPIQIPPVVAVRDVVALLEAERDRYWHTKEIDGKRILDRQATMACSNCSTAQRLLDDLLFKFRPAQEKARQMTTPPRLCCNICTP